MIKVQGQIWGGDRERREKIVKYIVCKKSIYWGE